MKKITILSLFILGIQGLNAQINISHPPVVDRTNSNVFLDASINFSSASGASNNVGKGLVVPSVDLVNFEFNADFVSSTDSPSFYDGMLVYNSAIGTTLTTGNRSSTETAVTPGFYYFSNPDGASNGNITNGVWTPMGGGTPTVPTALSTNSSTQIANTEFVANAVKTRLSIKTSDYELSSQDYTVLCNASSASISLTLPSPSESTDKIIIIKKIDTSYNQITFNPRVYVTDSETAISLNYPKTIKIQSNGTNWYVIN